jgi:hypothetical protein
MMFLDDLSQRKTSMRMDQPVQVQPKSYRPQQADKFLCIESRVSQHPSRNIDDPYRMAMLLEVRQNRHEADRVHLENLSGWDNIADGTIERMLLSEIIDAGSVQENEISMEHS